jgi:ribosomal protein S4E
VASRPWLINASAKPYMSRLDAGLHAKSMKLKVFVLRMLRVVFTARMKLMKIRAM